MNPPAFSCSEMSSRTKNHRTSPARVGGPVTLHRALDTEVLMTAFEGAREVRLTSTEFRRRRFATLPFHL
jgi:hypothetical protein